MKTFRSLIFKPHFNTLDKNAKKAFCEFDNGYSVSVVFGDMFYSNGVDTYELAIFKGDEICYNTDITNDVMGYLTHFEVTEVMKRVQELPPYEEDLKD